MTSISDSSAANPRFGSRLKLLRDKFAGKDIDGIIVYQPENRYYLSGFTGEDGYLFISNDKAVLATDFRYTEQAGKQCRDCEIVKIAGDMAGWLPDLVSRLKIKKIGFESGFMTYSFFQRMRDIFKDKLPGANLVPVNGVIEAIRAVKEPEEIDLITRAAEIADGAFKHLMERLKPGMTECQAAWELEKYMRENGSEIMPFNVIVASGPNGAMAHYEAGNRPIQAGEPVVMDFGARVGGYCSDMTRTICLGTQDKKFRQIYDIVLGAQLAAIAMIKPGMTGELADSMGRTIIQEAGYGEAFGHSLGHGIGLAVHETPRLGARSKDILLENMVFSVEPGIYLEGWGGIRTEDTVVLKDGKVKIITGSPK